LYCAHFGSSVGFARDFGSTYLPGMITTRSLLRDFLIAVWMLLNLQRRLNARLSRLSLRACPAVSFLVPREGRRTVPFLRAELIERIAFFSDARWHTTRVLPRGFAFRAEPRLRAFGILPPAAGFTLLSGAGSGQYELRST
jgi:hypothetical protein